MLADIARTDRPTAAPDTPVADAAAAMARRDVPFVVVLDEDRPLGVLTDGAVGRAVGTHEGLPARPVAALLPSTPPTVAADADLAALLSTFRAEGTDPVVVVDADGGYAGVVTFADALGAHGRDLAAVLDLLD